MISSEMKTRQSLISVHFVITFIPLLRSKQNKIYYPDLALTSHMSFSSLYIPPWDLTYQQAAIPSLWTCSNSSFTIMWLHLLQSLEKKSRFYAFFFFKAVILCQTFLSLTIETGYWDLKRKLIKRKIFSVLVLQVNM